MTTVPLAAWVTAVTVRVCRVRSVSLASTLIGDGGVLARCGVVARVGASLTGVTVTVTVAVSRAPLPSVTV